MPDDDFDDLQSQQLAHKRRTFGNEGFPFGDSFPLGHYRRSEGNIALLDADFEQANAVDLTANLHAGIVERWKGRLDIDFVATYPCR